MPLPSQHFRYEDLAVTTAPNGNRMLALCDGLAVDHYPLEMHITELAPGQAPHAPHRHHNSEIILVREGQVEVTINGKTEVLGPGSAAFVASMEEHGWRNAGTTPAAYFIIALGARKA